MYNPGDLVHYGSMGVCRVAEITARKPSGAEKERLYYVLNPLYQSCTISVPVDSPKVYMRPIISRDEAEQLIDKIPDIRAKAYHNRVLRQLTEHYENTLKSHDCEGLMELTMSIYAKKRDVEREKRRFGAVDERFMKRAEYLLFGELGAALGMPKDEVPDYIAFRIEEKKRGERECL